MNYWDTETVSVLTCKTNLAAMVMSVKDNCLGINNENFYSQGDSAWPCQDS